MKKTKIFRLHSKREKDNSRRFYRRCRAERSQNREIARLLYPAGEKTEPDPERGSRRSECGSLTGRPRTAEHLQKTLSILSRSAQSLFFPGFAPAPAGGEDSGRGGGEGGRDGRTERDSERETAVKMACGGRSGAGGRDRDGQQKEHRSTDTPAQHLFPQGPRRTQQQRSTIVRRSVRQSQKAKNQRA